MNIDGNAVAQYGQGAVIAIISIVMVFAVLLLIIILTDLVAKATGKNDEIVAVAANNTPTNYAVNKLNENDEDAMVACLVASIDYRNQTGKHIEVLNVREVK